MVFIPDLERGCIDIGGKKKKEEGNCIVLLFYVHGKHLRSYRDGQLT